MRTETIDKLFLELSQVTTAKTRREIDLEQQIALMSQIICALAEHGGGVLPQIVWENMGSDFRGYSKRLHPDGVQIVPVE